MGSHLAFTIGSLVNVTPESRKGRPNSDGGTACVVGKTDSGKFHVSYIVDRKISKEVHPSRLNESTIQTLKQSDNSSPSSMSALSTVRNDTSERVFSL